MARKTQYAIKVSVVSCGYAEKDDRMRKQLAYKGIPHPIVRHGQPLFPRTLLDFAPDGKDRDHEYHHHQDAGQNRIVQIDRIVQPRIGQSVRVDDNRLQEGHSRTLVHSFGLQRLQADRSIGQHGHRT